MEINGFLLMSSSQYNFTHKRKMMRLENSFHVEFMIYYIIFYKNKIMLQINFNITNFRHNKLHDFQIILSKQDSRIT